MLFCHLPFARHFIGPSLNATSHLNSAPLVHFLWFDLLPSKQPHKLIPFWFLFPLPFHSGFPFMFYSDRNHQKPSKETIKSLTSISGVPRSFLKLKNRHETSSSFRQFHHRCLHNVFFLEMVAPKNLTVMFLSISFLCRFIHNLFSHTPP